MVLGPLIPDEYDEGEVSMGVMEFLRVVEVRVEEGMAVTME